MTASPAIALGEQKLLTAFLQQRCLQLAQQLADVSAERDQALADRNAIRAERDDLLMDRREGERHGASE